MAINNKFYNLGRKKGREEMLNAVCDWLKLNCGKWNAATNTFDEPIDYDYLRRSMERRF